MGDIAIIDFKATRSDTNQLITGSQQRGLRLDTELGDRALGLAGMQRISQTPSLQIQRDNFTGGVEGAKRS